MVLTLSDLIKWSHLKKVKEYLKKCREFDKSNGVNSASMYIRAFQSVVKGSDKKDISLKTAKNAVLLTDFQSGEDDLDNGRIS